ncbi:MAG: hypothetical protein LBK52_00305 [Deltaproteobacteria bacterium]|jgi:hypothetical protein|nr:hypothetical protein [Deltaproteobacteria bacterium]
MLSKIYDLAGKQAFWAVSLVIIASLLGGCAGAKLGKQTVVVKHYPECYQPITDMRRAAEAVNKATATGAILGAITGAAIGYAESGHSRGAIKGAVAGGLAGAGLGYLVSSEVQSMEQADRFRTYFQAMDTDISNLQQAVAAARIASNCYDKQYQQLSRNYKAGRISREEMLERLNEIRSGSNDAMTILRNYNDQAANVANVYDELTRMERDRPDRAAASYINSIGKKKTSYNTQTRSAGNLISLMQKRSGAYDQLEHSITGENRPVRVLAENTQGYFLPCSF